MFTVAASVLKQSSINGSKKIIKTNSTLLKAYYKSNGLKTRQKMTDFYTKGLIFLGNLHLHMLVVRISCLSKLHLKKSCIHFSVCLT